MAKPKICVATPTRDGLVDTDFCSSLFQLQKLLGNDYDIEPTLVRGVSDIVGGRNKIFNKWFYETDVEYILWIDSDVAFHAPDVKSMLDRNVELIGGSYPKKKFDVANLLHTAAMMQQMDGQVVAEKALAASLNYVVGGKTDIFTKGELAGLIRCERMGMGFVLIRRGAATKLMNWASENMEKTTMYWNDKPVEGYAVFDPIKNESGDYYAEDYSFSWRLVQAGVQILIDPSMRLVHSGNVSFHGCYQDVLDFATKVYERGEEMPGDDYEKRFNDEREFVD